MCTRATRIEPACHGLQADFASLQLDDDAGLLSLSADGVEGVCTGEKQVHPLRDSAFRARSVCAHVPAKPAWTRPVAQTPPKHEVPSNSLPTQPSPPPTGGNLAAPRLAGTDSAWPAKVEPRADMDFVGILNYDISQAEFPRDKHGLPMWPRVEELTDFIAPKCSAAESDSDDWSDDEFGCEPRDAQGLRMWPCSERPARVRSESCDSSVAET